MRYFTFQTFVIMSFLLSSAYLSDDIKLSLSNQKKFNLSSLNEKFTICTLSTSSKVCHYSYQNATLEIKYGVPLQLNIDREKQTDFYSLERERISSLEILIAVVEEYVVIQGERGDYLFDFYENKLYYYLKGTAGLDQDSHLYTPDIINPLQVNSKKRELLSAVNCFPNTHIYPLIFAQGAQNIYEITTDRTTGDYVLAGVTTDTFISGEAAIIVLLNQNGFMWWTKAYKEEGIAHRMHSALFGAADTIYALEAIDTTWPSIYIHEVRQSDAYTLKSRQVTIAGVTLYIYPRLHYESSNLYITLGTDKTSYAQVAGDEYGLIIQLSTTDFSVLQAIPARMKTTFKLHASATYLWHLTWPTNGGTQSLQLIQMTASNPLSAKTQSFTYAPTQGNPLSAYGPTADKIYAWVANYDDTNHLVLMYDATSLNLDTAYYINPTGVQLNVRMDPVDMTIDVSEEVFVVSTLAINFHLMHFDNTMTLVRKTTIANDQSIDQVWFDFYGSSIFIAGNTVDTFFWIWEYQTNDLQEGRQNVQWNTDNTAEMSVVAIAPGSLGETISGTLTLPSVTADVSIGEYYPIEATSWYEENYPIGTHPSYVLTDLPGLVVTDSTTWSVTATEGIFSKIEIPEWVGTCKGTFDQAIESTDTNLLKYSEVWDGHLYLQFPLGSSGFYSRQLTAKRPTATTTEATRPVTINVLTNTDYFCPLEHSDAQHYPRQFDLTDNPIISKIEFEWDSYLVCAESSTSQPILHFIDVNGIHKGGASIAVTGMIGQSMPDCSMGEDWMTAYLTLDGTEASISQARVFPMKYSIDKGLEWQRKFAHTGTGGISTLFLKYDPRSHDVFILIQSSEPTHLTTGTNISILYKLYNKDGSIHTQTGFGDTMSAVSIHTNPFKHYLMIIGENNNQILAMQIDSTDGDIVGTWTTSDATVSSQTQRTYGVFQSEDAFIGLWDYDPVGNGRGVSLVKYNTMEGQFGLVEGTTITNVAGFSMQLSGAITDEQGNIFFTAKQGSDSLFVKVSQELVLQHARKLYASNPSLATRLSYYSPEMFIIKTDTTCITECYLTIYKIDVYFGVKTPESHTTTTMGITLGDFMTNWSQANFNTIYTSSTSTLMPQLFNPYMTTENISFFTATKYDAGYLKTSDQGTTMLNLAPQRIDPFFTLNNVDMIVDQTHYQYAIPEDPKSLFTHCLNEDIYTWWEFDSSTLMPSWIQHDTVNNAFIISPTVSELGTHTIYLKARSDINPGTYSHEYSFTITVHDIPRFTEEFVPYHEVWQLYPLVYTLPAFTSEGDATYEIIGRESQTHELNSRWLVSTDDPLSGLDSTFSDLTTIGFYDFSGFTSWTELGSLVENQFIIVSMPEDYLRNTYTVRVSDQYGSAEGSFTVITKPIYIHPFLLNYPFLTAGIFITLLSSFLYIINGDPSLLEQSIACQKIFVLYLMRQVPVPPIFKHWNAFWISDTNIDIIIVLVITIVVAVGLYMTRWRVNGQLMFMRVFRFFIVPMAIGCAMSEAMAVIFVTLIPIYIILCCIGYTYMFMGKITDPFDQLFVDLVNNEKNFNHSVTIYEAPLVCLLLLIQTWVAVDINSIPFFIILEGVVLAAGLSAGYFWALVFFVIPKVCIIVLYLNIDIYLNAWICIYLALFNILLIIYEIIKMIVERSLLLPGCWIKRRRAIKKKEEEQEKVWQKKQQEDITLLGPLALNSSSRTEKHEFHNNSQTVIHHYHHEKHVEHHNHREDKISSDGTSNSITSKNRRKKPKKKKSEQKYEINEEQINVIPAPEPEMPVEKEVKEPENQLKVPEEEEPQITNADVHSVPVENKIRKKKKIRTSSYSSQNVMIIEKHIHHHHNHLGEEIKIEDQKQIEEKKEPPKEEKKEEETKNQTPEQKKFGAHNMAYLLDQYYRMKEIITKETFLKNKDALCRKVFKECDDDNNSVLDKNELIVTVQKWYEATGVFHRPQKEDVDVYYVDDYTDGAKTTDYEEFKQYMVYDMKVRLFKPLRKYLLALGIKLDD